MRSMSAIFFVAIRVFLGSVFLFSGLVKLNDPLGTAIKLEEYFSVFSGDISGIFAVFIPFSLGISFGVILLELGIGLGLVMGHRLFYMAWTSAALVLFFGWLTFYSAYFDKVTDCGCFGDAIKLTPWQSFIKDMVLLGLNTPLLIWIHKKRARKNEEVEDGEKGGGIFRKRLFWDGFLFLFLCIWGLVGTYAVRHLPYIDFRAYKVGKDIDAMRKPSGEIIYEYVMEKGGKKAVFSAYPQDTSYHFVSLGIANPSVLPEIQDYVLWRGEENVTDASLEGLRLLILVQGDLGANKRRLVGAGEVVQSLSPDILPWVITSLSASAYKEMSVGTGMASVAHYFGDATLLKTMLRAGVGYVLLRDGVIVGKWHDNDVSDAQVFTHALQR